MACGVLPQAARGDSVVTRPIHLADKHSRQPVRQPPSERMVFAVGVIAAAIIGFVIVFVHPS